VRPFAKVKMLLYAPKMLFVSFHVCQAAEVVRKNQVSVVFLLLMIAC